MEMDVELKPSFKLHFVTIFLLTFLFSLSFFRSVLMGDEVFVVFSFGPEISASPVKVLEWAINSSTVGWNTGRFVSPISHVISNFGVLLSYKTSQFFQIDVLTAYGVWRSLLSSILAVLSMAILLKFIPKSLPTNRKKLELALFAVIFPGTMITNSSVSATRISIWSYHILLILTLVLLLLYLKIAKFNKVGKNSIIIFLVANVGPAILGLAFATSYELSQALAPLAIFAFASVKRINAPENFGIRKTFFRHMACIENIIFSFFFFAAFLIIRISSYRFCHNNGCYDAANLTANNFSFVNVAERAVSALPMVSIPIGFSKNWELLQSPILILGSAVIGILFIWVFKIHNVAQGKNYQLNEGGSNHAWQAQVLIFGMLIILLISTGMALSQAVQQNRLPAFESSRDTLVLNLGVSFIIFSLFSLISSKIYLLRSIKTLVVFTTFRYVFIFFLVSLAFLSNIITTKSSLSEPGKMLQIRFAVELSDPDLTEFGDARRCSYIKQKLSSYPEWHDGHLVWGLNLAMQEKTGIPFCSIDGETLFLNYAGGM